ncbi:MAG TPA: GntR family transcriptional regulator [Bacillota bacterium]|nr:GntR family transcriptional regulator [Bacillota bacterium]
MSNHDPASKAPKYFLLKEHLKLLIRRGEFTPGSLLPSEHTLAKQFKYSRHTVRQAIGELENEGLVYREQGRGTFCAPQNQIVSARTIALVTTYISEYIFPSVIRGVEEVLSMAGYSLLLANTANDKFKEAQCLENLLNQDIAGLIIEPTKSAQGNSNARYFEELDKRRIPYLMLHAFYPELDPAYIVMDDEKGGYMATRYLLQLGHRNIAGIFKSDDLQGIKRQLGFTTALAEFHHEPHPGLIGNYDTEHQKTFPYQFVRELLQKTPRPTAILCYNDQVALIVMEALREEGLKVPEQISVIGYDDSTLALIPEIKLTTIKHPKTQMGREAARFIIDMVEGKVQKPRLNYQPELIIRASCANPQ